MQHQPTDAYTGRGLSRRQWLQASLIGGAALGAWPLCRLSALGSEAAGPPKWGDVGIETTMKLQEYGAYMAPTFVGKFEGMAMRQIRIAWEPDSVLYGLYAPGQSRNSGHVNDPILTAMLQEQRRIPDLETRKQRIFDIQRYAAEQQYYVYTSSRMITASWQP